MNILSERWKSIALFLLLLLLALVLTTVETRVAPQTSIVESLVISAVAPLQEVVSGGMQGVYSIWNDYINLVQVRHENVRLRKQVVELRGQLHRHQEAYLQQQRLRELLGFRSLSFPHAVAAEVVGIDPSQWSEAITINKGRNYRVQKDVAVVKLLAFKD